SMGVPWIVQQLASWNPHAVLSAASGLPEGIAWQLRSAAVGRMVALDLPAAIATLTSSPLGTESNELIALVASEYVRQDPDAALEWVLSLNPIEPQVLTGVVREIARSDLGWAV